MTKALYHFTAVERLPVIMREGLRLGDVPTGQFTGRNGVWLTIDPAPAGHGLGSASEMSDEDRQWVLKWRGVLPPEGTRWPDKSAVRIAVRGLPDTGRLVRWSRWGRRNCAPGMYDGLVRAGGAKHRSWYVYFGIIPAEYFAAVEFKDADGKYEPRAESVPIADAA